MKGFTLLELLVALAISSILAAIAVPQYGAYRKRAFDQRALSDLQAVAIAEEAYFLDHEEYLSCSSESCLELPGIAAISRGVTLDVQGGPDLFTGTSTHTQGSGRVFNWDSSRGGLVE